MATRKSPENRAAVQGVVKNLPSNRHFACHAGDMKNLWWLAWLGVSTWGTCAEEAREFIPSPLTLSDEIPGHPWDGKGAGEFKGPFAAALKELLAAGFPDPAGLAYEKIAIPTGNCWGGDTGVIETEGWLLPAEKDGAVYAIGWNGLVYPVVRTLGPADFEKSIQSFMAITERPDAPFGWQGNESAEVLPEQAFGMHGLFLTRFNQMAAVDFLLKQRDGVPKNLTLAMADEWAFNLYDRAVCAHMRGDARLALASLRELEKIRPALLKLLVPGEGEKPHHGWTPLEWAAQAGNLKTECERRINNGTTGMLNEAEFLTGKPDVPTLIGALDRLAVRQDGQPGWVPFGKSPIIKALVAADAKAVEPLLDCLENDRRLTQSVHYWRDFSKDRTVLGVHEAALAALEQILAANYYKTVSTGGDLTRGGDEARAKMVETIRADWLAHGKMTGMERAYRTLANDHADPDLWADAAASLFVGGEKPDFSKPQPGEVLRDGREPSVGELLERRVAGAVKKGEANLFYERRRCRLLSCLLAWEPDRGRPVVAKQVDAWLADGSWKTAAREPIANFINRSVNDAPDLLRLFEVMAWSSEAKDFNDFGPGETVTEILAEFGDSPLLKRSRDGLFTDPKSPWCLTNISEPHLSRMLEMWSKKKLTFREPFRKALLQALSDDAVAGTAMLDPKDPKRWLGDFTMYRQSYKIPDDPLFTLKPGVKVSVRKKDIVAKALGDPDPRKKPAAPALEYWWPKEKRDAKIAEMINLINGPV
jgi:hypothetical protein